MLNIKNKIYIIVILSLLLSGCQKNNFGISLEGNNKLREVKSKIVIEKIINIDNQEMVQYGYKSGRKTAKEKLNNFDEIVEKRTKNKRFFKTDNENEYIMDYHFEDMFYFENGEWYDIDYDNSTIPEYEQEVRRITKRWYDFILPKTALADLVEQSISEDNWINKDDPTTNHGTQITLTVGGQTAFDTRALFRIPMPAGSGTVTDVDLIVVASSLNLNTNVNLHELTRTDWSEAQSTWNIYKTGSNWTSAGGDYNATIVDNLTVSAGTNTFGLMGSNAGNPLTLTWSDTTNIIIKYPSTSASYNQFNLASAENGNAGNRPHLHITYTAPVPVLNNVKINNVNFN